MGWYRIIIKQKNIRKSLSGIRHYDETNHQKVEKTVRDQAYKKLGEETIDDIVITKLPPDHPDVLEHIRKTAKQ